MRVELGVSHFLTREMGAKNDFQFSNQISDYGVTKVSLSST